MQTENPQHRVFIQTCLRTGDKRLAYKTAYPEIADGDSLRVASNRLYRKLRLQITALEERACELAVAEMMQDATARIKTEICSMQQRREVLAAMILGHTKHKRFIRLKDRVVEVEEDVSPAVLIRAIDLDSRLAANKYKERGIEYTKPQIAEPVQAAAIPVIKADPDTLLPLDERLKKYPYGHEHWKGTRIKLHDAEITRFGFDLLDEGIPYLNNELTEEFMQIRLHRDIDDFKKYYPEEAKDMFGDGYTLINRLPVTIIPDEEPKVTEDKPNVEPVTAPLQDEKQPETILTEVDALWAQYLKLDSNTRRLHPQDRKQKETWFRAIPQKQRLRLINLYRQTG